MKTPAVSEAEIRHLLDFLAANPHNAYSAVKSSVARAVLLRTDGALFSHGSLWDIKAKNLGAGVYRVSLEKQI